MKILHVVPTYLPATRYGGPIYSVHGLCKGLVSLGHDVHVFTTNVDGSRDSDVPLCESVDIDGVKVWYFPSQYGRRLYYSPQMKQALQRCARKFDFIHLHSVFLWPTWMAARLAYRQGVPYIVSPRGMLVSDLIQRKSRWVKSIWISLIEKKTLSQSASVHVTTDAEGEEIKKLNLDIPSLFCVPNGLDIPSRDGSVDADYIDTLPKPYVLFLGRVNWKKGLDRLIQSWKTIQSVHLIVAGNDEENYQPKLEELAEKEGVRERVHFIGSVEGNRKWALYKHAKLFVLPSYSENFGNVVLEAMIMGCPVVVTPEVGLASMVKEKGVGCVVDGDPRRLAESINILLCDDNRRKKMGQKGIQVATQDYSWESIARQMEQVYINITTSGQGGVRCD